MRKNLSLCLFLVSAGCVLGGCSASREETISKEVEENIREVDFRAKESETLSGLAKLEEALHAYTTTEKKIPSTLEELIPKYLAEIPMVELAVRGHGDNNKVKIYPSSVLRAGTIDGSQLKDTGRWGYVFNDRQVVVFVDCTHQSSRGRPWYQERGVF